MAALDEARAFFGESWRLAVVPDWKAYTHGPHGALTGEAQGKRYHAHMTVHIIEPR